MFLPKQVELINDTIIIPYEDENTSRGKIFDLFITHFETTSVIDYSDADGNLVSDIIPDYYEKILELVYQSNGM
jgi:hypothetical protein